jgi:valyl-tRNA synthetase
MREKEKARLLKEREKLIGQQNGTRVKLGNQDFVLKAPPQLVEKLQLNLQQAEKDLFEIAQKLEKLLTLLRPLKGSVCRRRQPDPSN